MMTETRDDVLERKVDAMIQAAEENGIHIDDLSWTPVEDLQDVGDIDWDVVRKGGYKVALSTSSQEIADAAALCRDTIWRTLDVYDPSRECPFGSRESWWKYAAIVRVPHLIQPHFGSVQPPENIEGASMVTVYRRGGMPRFIPRAQFNGYSWEHTGDKTDIVAYIVHPYLDTSNE